MGAGVIRGGEPVGNPPDVPDEGMSRHEPMPVPDPSRGDVQSLVIADIEERRRVGIARYGTPLQTFNGRDALIDLYQELLDAVMYTRQLIEERADRANRLLQDSPIDKPMLRALRIAVADDNATRASLLTKIDELLKR